MKDPVYALYARVSHDDKVQDPEVQLEPMRQYCKAKGVKWIEYVDRETGRTIEREGYQCAMGEIERWDVFMVMFADRLTREGPERGKVEVRRILQTSKGFQIFSAGVIIQDKMTATTELLLDMLFSLAHFESNIISERTIAGMEKKRREIEEQGYTISKRTGQRIEGLGRKPSVQVSIDQILLLKDQGLSLQQIADRLGSKKSTIHNILKREYGN